VGLPFHSARLKLERAQEHIERLGELVEDWLETDAYTVSRETDPETGYTVRRAKIKSPPPHLISTVAGDAIQNLRTALDHAVFEMASRAGPVSRATESRLMFPIAGNENTKGEPADGEVIFRRMIASGYLTGVPDRARDFIQQEQPYRWNEEADGYKYHSLWTVHDLNRIDKHRRLTVATAFLDMQFVTTPASVEPRITFHRAEGPVRDGDPLVTYEGAEAGVDAHFTRGVALAEGVAAGRGAGELLRNVHQRIEWMLYVLEQSA
jgi:hypothetical protein